MKNNISVGQIETVERRILLIRGSKVIVDADLAEFYGVSTKRLREQIRRNKERFSEDFLFRLIHQEKRQVADACPHISLDILGQCHTPLPSMEP
jgi:predicted YcjX-like family ATPase